MSFCWVPYASIAQSCDIVVVVVVPVVVVVGLVVVVEEEEESRRCQTRRKEACGGIKIRSEIQQTIALQLSLRRNCFFFFLSFFFKFFSIL